MMADYRAKHVAQFDDGALGFPNQFFAGNALLRLRQRGTVLFALVCVSSSR